MIDTEEDVRRMMLGILLSMSADSAVENGLSFHAWMQEAQEAYRASKNRERDE